MNADTETVVRRLRDGMAGGVLSFPLTSFHDDGSLDPAPASAPMSRPRSPPPPAPCSPACGTGEFFSLDEDEYRTVVTVAVEEAAYRVPVVA